MLNGKTILVTGGTGSFGHKFIGTVLEKHKPKKLIVYSRDEYKQYMMQQKFREHDDVIRYFLGDVRDYNRLCHAFEGVDYVIHAAALKQVPALEYNPTEAVRTNVTGAENIVNAAIDKGVGKVVALSTDKAVNPVNLYGATKLVAEKIFISGNQYGGGKVKFCAVRYGNVLGSRGSVIPLFVAMKKAGVTEYPVTDTRMTRFWLTLEEAVELVMTALRETEGGEVFVPCIPSMKITDLAKAVNPDCTLKHIGIRPGEKLHECLISCDEARKAKIVGDVYVVLPQFFDNDRMLAKYQKYPDVPDDFVYQSDTNDAWMTEKELREICKEFEA